MYAIQNNEFFFGEIFPLDNKNKKLKKNWKILKILGVNSTKENTKISGKIAKILTPKNFKIKNTGL